MLNAVARKFQKAAVSEILIYFCLRFCIRELRRWLIKQKSSL